LSAQADRETLRARFSKYERHGKKFAKALDVVSLGGVKEHRFLPSGSSLFTVVGNLGDEFIDPMRPYCSCGHFFFKVRRGMDDTCYHLLSYSIASEAKLVDVITFDDEEFGQMVQAVAADVYHVMDAG
jgi:predicted nucleic acid-binding Zn finger protein